MAADHFRFPFLFSGGAGGMDHHQQWFTVRFNVLADFVVADDGEVTSDEVAKVLGFDFTTKLWACLFYPVKMEHCPTTLDSDG